VIRSSSPASLTGFSDLLVEAPRSLPLVSDPLQIETGLRTIRGLDTAYAACAHGHVKRSASW